MKTIIVGMRNFLNYGTVCNALDECGWTPTEIVSGRATGVNALGERWAAEHGLPVKEFHADWKAHGKAAGLLRNGQMAAYADALVAIWDGRSRGTGRMIEQARHHGLRVYVHLVQQGYAIALLEKRKGQAAALTATPKTLNAEAVSLRSPGQRQPVL